MKYQVVIEVTREYVINVDVTEQLANDLASGAQSEQALLALAHEQYDEDAIDDRINSITEKVVDWDHLSDND